MMAKPYYWIFKKGKSVYQTDASTGQTIRLGSAKEFEKAVKRGKKLRRKLTGKKKR